MASYILFTSALVDWNRVKMKAIILAAGPTLSVKQAKNYPLYFPEDSKPKCLFHFGGEILLERQVRLLNECGVTDIRVVVGYKKEMIQQFIEEKKWDVETVYNPDYPPGNAFLDGRKTGRGWLKGLTSVRVGLQGVDDDVLVTLGDVSLHENGLTRILQDKYKQAVIKFNLFKISKEKLPLLRKYRKPGLAKSLYDFIIVHDGVIIGSTENPKWYHQIADVDYYLQTDEGTATFKKIGMVREELIDLPTDEVIRLLREET